MTSTADLLETLQEERDMYDTLLHDLVVSLCKKVDHTESLEVREAYISSIAEIICYAQDILPPSDDIMAILRDYYKGISQ